jgi:hypothetical protein
MDGRKCGLNDGALRIGYAERALRRATPQALVDFTEEEQGYA